MSAPAGWYPQDDGGHRYWDGSQWTEQVAPTEGATTGASAVDPETGPTRPWFKKKRVIIPAGLVALVIVGSALSPDDATTPTASPISSRSSTSPTPKVEDPAAVKAAADAKAKAEAAAKVKAAADAKVKAAADAKAAAAAKAKAAAEAKAKAAADAKAKAAALLAPYNDTYGSFVPLSKKGRGDAVVSLPKGASIGIVTISHKGSSNFAASVLDSSNQATGDLLVNEIGSYSGVTAYGLNSLGGTPTKIQITADGSWTIRVAPVSSAPVLPKTATGSGDKVFRFDGSASDWAITHKGSGNFAVLQVGGLLPNLAVNEIGNYSGVVPFSEGPSVVTITADGRWSMVAK